MGIHKPFEYLDLYKQVRDKSEADIEHEMMRLSKSIQMVRLWRSRCAMWMGDTHLTSSFGYTIELYRRGTFNTIDQLSAQVASGALVSDRVARANAQVVFGFDRPVRKLIKPMDEIYAHYLDNLSLSVAELAEWGGHGSITEINSLVMLHKNVRAGARVVWQLWNEGLDAGDSKKQMYQRFREAGVASGSAFRYIAMCEVISGVKLEVPLLQVEFAQQLIMDNPGLTINQLVKKGVDSVRRASSVQRLLLMYNRLNGYPLVDDVAGDESKMEISSCLIDGSNMSLSDWIDHMVLNGCYAQAAYAYYKKVMN